MIRHLEVLMKEVDDIYLETNDGKKNSVSDDEDDGSKFERKRNEINAKLISTRELCEGLNQKNSENVTQQTFRLKKEAESLIEEIRHDIDDLDKIIKDETGVKKLTSLMSAELGCTWKIAAMAREKIEPTIGVSSYVYMISTISNFKEFTDDSNYGSKTDLEKILAPPKEEQKLVDKLYKLMDKDGDGKISPMDQDCFTKLCQILVNRCHLMLLLKKQLDFIDHGYKPETFRRKLRFNKDKIGAFNMGEHGIANLTGDESGPPLGKAGKMKAERNKRERSQGAAYRPQPPSEQELVFLQRSAAMEEQLNQDLDEIMQGLKRVNKIAIDINDDLEAQKEIMDTLDDRMHILDTQIGDGIDRLEELLEKSGGASTWCPRIIAFIVVMAIIGYLVKGGKGG